MALKHKIEASIVDSKPTLFVVLVDMIDMDSIIDVVSIYKLK